jgi:YHS domain-containing protein
MAFKYGVMLFMALFSFHANGFAKSEIYTSFFSSSAAGGYDTVAYFNENQPVRGLDEYRTTYKGAKWYFSNQKNLEMFKANPEKYAPQYGGYCAWAVAEGDTAKGDPLHWTLHNGKLYLNYDETIKNRWLKNVDDFITKADANWPKVIE